MPSDLNIQNAERFMSEIQVHDIESGGRFVSISGAKGCGKTNLMLIWAHRMCFIHPATKDVVKETVLWRARPSLDYWNYYLDPDFEWENDAMKREVYVHYRSEDNLTFVLETGEIFVPPRKCLVPYTSVVDLYEHLVPGAINVIYEPGEYSPSQAFRDIITARGFYQEKVWDNRNIDPTIFWIEFLSFLMQVKKAGFYTLMMDEADEVFPQHPRDLRYACQSYFKDLTRDLRKHNITYILSFHTWGDLDWEITSKIMYKVWMKGAQPPEKSILMKSNKRWSGARFDPIQLHYLQTGHAIIESNGWGDTNTRKLKERSRVKTIYKSMQEGIDADAWKPVVGGGRPKKDSKKNRQIDQAAEWLAQDPANGATLDEWMASLQR
jgi:hypothetical protein